MLIRLCVAMLRIWPTRWALAFGAALGHLAYRLHIRRAVALSNLALAFPEKSSAERQKICRAHYRGLGLAAVEFFLAEAMLARIDEGNWELLARTRAEGKGLIVCVAHLGSFELFAAYSVHRGLPFTVVTRSLKGAFNRAWLSQRTRLGVRELHGHGVINQMVHVLRNEEALALVIDQNMRPKRASFVPFFGQLAATTAAPAILSARTGANVLLGALLREPDGCFRIWFEGPFGQRGHELTRALSQSLEALVRAHPEQWFWVHRRWKTRPEKESPGSITAIV